MKTFTFLMILGLSAISLFAQKEEKLKIIVNDPSVRVINENVNANCCSLYDYKIEEDTTYIKITETDTSTQKCKCMCYFDLETGLKFLNSGHYIVDVYRRELVKYGYPDDKDIFIGRDSFDIVNPLSPPLRYTFKQWDCNVSAAVQDNEVTSPEIMVYPNPVTSGTANIELNAGAAGYVSVSIYNILGSPVQRQEKIYAGQDGKNIITVNTETLPNGAYTCIITDGSGRVKTFRMNVVK